MSRLRETQENFAHALLKGETLSVRDGIVSEDIRADDRISIYRNNVFFSLTEALADTFPIIERLVGRDFFKFAAREFVASHPPTHGVLAAYGSGFADFLEAFEPAAQHPYLPDVARLEFAWLEAYHSIDQAPLASETLAAIDPQFFAELRLTLHPSGRLIGSRFPIARIWEVNQPDVVEPEIIDLTDGPNYIFVIRPRADVEVRTLSIATYEFLSQLAIGQTLTTSYESALNMDAEFDLQLNLQSLISGETFVNYEITQ